MTSSQKDIFITLIFICLLLLGEAPATLAQPTNQQSYKNISCALGMVHFIPPGFGYGIKIGLPVSESHNLAIPIKFSHYALPHGKYEGEEGYDYPWVVQLASGITCFKEETLFQKSFQSCRVLFDYGMFDDPKSNAKGNFQALELLVDWGYRAKIYKRLFIEASWGIGWMVGKVNRIHSDQTTLGEPRVNGLTLDWNIEIGILF